MTSNHFYSTKENKKRKDRVFIEQIETASIFILFILSIYKYKDIVVIDEAILCG